MTTRVLTIFLVSLISFTQSIASDELAQFEQANTHFQKKEYTKAIEAYQTILATGLHSPELHYNLANAFYENQQIGKAILHFERALLLNPSDQDVQYNLSIAQQQLRDDLEVLPTFFLTQWWRSLRQFLSSGAWSFITLLLLWLGVAGLVIWLLGYSRKQKKWGFFAGIVLLVLSLLPFNLAMNRAEVEKDSGFAIILEKRLPLQSAPDAASTEIIQLHEGIKVELLDTINDWYKVKLSNGEQGWLPKSAVEEI